MRKYIPKKRQKIFFPHRTKFTAVFTSIIFAIIIFRLFSLQVMQGKSYAEKAINQRSKKIEISARRGEILIRDSATDSLVKLATNTTLDLIYVDPYICADKNKIAKTIAPFLFTQKDFELCQEDTDFCPEKSITYIENEYEEKDENGNIVIKIEKEAIPPASLETAISAYSENILERISKEDIDFVVLKRDLLEEEIQKIPLLGIPGVGLNRKQALVYADPTAFSSEKERKNAANVLSKELSMDKDLLMQKLKGGKIRYVKLKKRISPEISNRILDVKNKSKEIHEEDKERIFMSKTSETEKPIPDYFRCIVLVPEHLRYYPDNILASQVVGFINHDKVGQYGIEGKFETELIGKKGIIESQDDISGMDIGMGADDIKDAENGYSIVLTIDRIIQKRVEEILAKAVEKYKADSAQVVIMDPFSGEIIAMANYPTFNPNRFGNVYLRRRTTPEDAKKIFKTTPIFKKNESGDMAISSFEEFEEAWKLGFDPEFYVYENWSGPMSYVNKAVQEVYEPGSVFKPLIMAAAIDAGEILPSTTFNEDGPVKVGDFEIHTALDEYHGIQTMTNILETSSNVGMAFVAGKLGKAVMYDYIKKFGLGEYTDIELENEVEGQVMHYKKWSDALLITSSFGQGLSATPIQIATAWSALANGGLLVKPHIVAEIMRDGKVVKKNERQEVRRAISPETSSIITQMLVSSVDKGVAHAAKIPGHRIAGKTGTSQIADVHGRGYEDTSEEGSVITSFAGYAPINKPRFIILVKIDRARVGQNAYGSTTAAPVFKEIASYLFEYYHIPPDEE